MIRKSALLIRVVLVLFVAALAQSKASAACPTPYDTCQYLDCGYSATITNVATDCHDWREWLIYWKHCTSTTTTFRCCKAAGKCCPCVILTVTPVADDPCPPGPPDD